MGLAGWQGAIAGIFIDLGCDYSINKITNMMESIMRGDSYWESVRHAYLDSAAETAKIPQTPANISRNTRLFPALRDIIFCMWTIPATD